MTVLFLNFLREEWKYVAIIGLLAGLYCVIYQHGYHSCEVEVAIEREKSTKAAQAIAEQEKQKLLSDNKAQQLKNIDLQKRLDNELKKKIYSDCIIGSDSVRILNKTGR